MPGGRRIAFRHIAGEGPTVVFLPGYMSDMDGSKATALFEAAKAAGRACLLLDYSGCGRSEGEFADGTLSRWRDEVLALVEAHVAGELVLVGSSIGGWLMLLVARELGDRLHGMVGIAPAPDFTEWGYSQEQKSQLHAGDTIFEDNPYGPEPTPTHAGFWQDGEALKQLGSTIPITCPVRLLHGQDDADVPPDISLRLAEALASQDVRITFVKAGDHRLSREQDVELLLSAVAELA